MSSSSGESDVFVGIDDGMFLKGKSKWTVLVGVKFNGLSWERTALEKIYVDQLNGTDSALRLLERLVEKGERCTVFLDGVTFAGFNVIDPNALYERTKFSIVSIFRRRPNREKIERALKLHFSDWMLRWEIISRVSDEIDEVSIRGRKLFFYSPNNVALASSMIRRMALVSKIPEPLRIADMLAKELGRFFLSFTYT
ncbi:MAG: DUF99 family protein [Fervidicoccaceae archaeon]